MHWICKSHELSVITSGLKQKGLKYFTLCNASTHKTKILIQYSNIKNHSYHSPIHTCLPTSQTNIVWLFYNLVGVFFYLNPEYAQLFAALIARTAKDVDVLIDSLPSEESTAALQVSTFISFTDIYFSAQERNTYPQNLR